MATQQAIRSKTKKPAATRPSTQLRGWRRLLLIFYIILLSVVLPFICWGSWGTPAHPHAGPHIVSHHPVSRHPVSRQPSQYLVGNEKVLVNQLASKTERICSTHHHSESEMSRHSSTRHHLPTEQIASVKQIVSVEQVVPEKESAPAGRSTPDTTSVISLIIAPLFLAKAFFVYLRKETIWLANYIREESAALPVPTPPPRFALIPYSTECARNEILA